MDGCRCMYDLPFRLGDFTGTVETKCPSCKTVHTLGHGDATQDVRCVGAFKGRLGGWCGHLVMRISADSVGELEYKCPRCSERRTLRLDTRILVTSS